MAVVHHDRSVAPLELFQAVGDAAELLWVLDDSLVSDDALVRLLGRLGTVVDIAGLDDDEASAHLAEYQPDGIVSFVDERLELAAALAARLGLAFHSPEVAEVLVDKRRQREVLARAGVPGPKFWPIPVRSSSADLARIAAGATYPAVLKPARGSGSRGILHARSPDELLSHLESDNTGPGYVLEEYLYDDPDRDRRFASYLSVESVISSGRVDHVALTGRFPLAEPFRETGNFIPAVLSPSLRAPVCEIVDAAVESLGITSAVIHTEIKLTPHGPRLIEVNGRLGGRPPFVLRAVSGLNLFEVVCRVSMGKPLDFDGPPQTRGVGFWRIVQPPMSARTVISVEGLDQVTVLPGVDVVSVQRGPGAGIDWRDGTDAQVLSVRGRVPDHDALAERIASIERSLTICYGE